MEQRNLNATDDGSGHPNPEAPPELRCFEFLLGDWRCEARLKNDDDTWLRLKATWRGRYVLDGYAIEDEFRLQTMDDELLVLGLNFRAYDAKAGRWNLKWLSGLAGTWTDLGSEELGGVSIAGNEISYCMKEPLAHHALTRATYIDVDPGRFRWRGERSTDGRQWEEFMVIEAYRQIGG